MTDQKIALLQQKSMLIAKLLSRISANDFNGVQAIAGDIREIDAKLSVLSGIGDVQNGPKPTESGWDTRFG